MFEVAFGMFAGVILGIAYKSLSTVKLSSGPGGVIARLQDHNTGVPDESVLVSGDDVALILAVAKNYEETVQELVTRVHETDRLVVELRAREVLTGTTVIVPGVTLRATPAVEPAVPQPSPKVAKPKATKAAQPKATKAAQPKVAKGGRKR